MANTVAPSESPDCLFMHDQLQFSMPDSDNIFDEVFDQRLYDVENDSNGYHELSNTAFDLYTNGDVQEDYPRLPSLSGSTSQETSNGQSPPQPWRKGLWCLNQDNVQVHKTRKPIIDTISSSQLVSNPAFLIRSPPTPSLSSTMKLTKRFVTSPSAAKHRHKGLMNVPFSRENTLSPSPMHDKMEQIETWQQDFKNFNLQSSQGKRLVGSGGLHHNAGPVSHDNSALIARRGPDEVPLDSGSTFLYHDQNKTVNALNPRLTHKSGSGLEIQTQSNRPRDIAMPAPVQNMQPCLAPLWTTESLHSSHSSTESSRDTMPPSLTSGLSSSGLHNLLNQMWWSPHMAPSTPGWATTPRDPYSDIAAPTPKRAVTHSFADDIDLRTNGLGIHYGDYDLSANLTESNMVYPSIESRRPKEYSPQRNELGIGIPPVPPLPYPLPDQSFPNSSPFASPRTVGRSPTRAPSPSVSPVSMMPHTTRRNGSPSRPDHPHSAHRRRKSIHKPGPIKSITTAAVDEPLPSANSSRARSRSQSKPPRTPRTPKTPKTPTGGFNVDFVNFTARDASKLLSDVAPSGSSKTRARREAEAKEKRKKLSEAALNAVSNAGGDTASIEALKRAILA